MLDFFKSMFEWQRNNTVLPVRGAKTVCIICLKEISAEDTHQNCAVAFSKAMPKCRLCGTAIYPAEPHVACNELLVKNLSSRWQCIICAQDEREGDHTSCMETISSFRRSLKILE